MYDGGSGASGVDLGSAHIPRLLRCHFFLPSCFILPTVPRELAHLQHQPCDMQARFSPRACMSKSNDRFHNGELCYLPLHLRIDQSHIVILTCCGYMSGFHQHQPFNEQRLLPTPASSSVKPPDLDPNPLSLQHSSISSSPPPLSKRQCLLISMSLILIQNPPRVPLVAFSRAWIPLRTCQSHAPVLPRASSHNVRRSSLLGGAGACGRTVGFLSGGKSPGQCHGGTTRFFGSKCYLVTCLGPF